MPARTKHPFADLTYLAPMLCIGTCLFLLYDRGRNDDAIPIVVALMVVPPLLALIFAIASFVKKERCPRIIAFGATLALLPTLIPALIFLCVAMTFHL